MAYRELVLLGLTHLDLHRIPELARAKGLAAAEVMQLLDDLEIDNEVQGLLAGARVKPLPASAYSSHLG